MIVRSACLEGQPKPGQARTFDELIVREIAPLMQEFPGVRGTRILRSAVVEDGGPALYLSFESVYDSQEAMRTAFAAPIRQQLRARLAEIMPLFDGRLFHITQELLHDDRLMPSAAR